MHTPPPTSPTQPGAELYDALRWYGPSGVLVTGDRAARHLLAAADLMTRENWDPQRCHRDSGRHLHDALYVTAHDGGNGDDDTRAVAGQVLEAVLCIYTGAPWVDHRAWSRHRDRTLGEVLAVARLAAAVARMIGPAAPPPAGDRPTAPEHPSLPTAPERPSLTP
ncbi:hypothetical protein [Streptomyces sp. CC224B]|uniref:DUF6197 family protein n=1 Tax=Streptomyces sp. CC224B TaxID=3044571 RepID=UPI0024A82F3D|nr:hypothetical protein [Streptomyces sp. CC224B]